MGRDHRAIARLKIQSLRCGKIHPRLRLVVAGDLRTQNRIPTKIVSARQVHHQRNIAVRDRRKQKPAPQLRKAAGHVVPRVQAVPGQGKVLQGTLVHLFQPEARAQPVEHTPMQYIEPTKRYSPRPNLLHGRLIFSAPRVRECQPVESVPLRFEDRLGLARDPSPPVDQCPKYIEEQRLYHRFCSGGAIIHWASFARVCNARSFQTHHFPFVAEGSVQLLVEFDRRLVPVQHVEHHSKTVFFPCQRRDLREQGAPNALAPELGPHVNVFEEESSAAKSGIVIKEDGVAHDLGVPFGHKSAELGTRPEAVTQQSFLRNGSAIVLKFRKFVDQSLEQRSVSGDGRTNGEHGQRLRATRLCIIPSPFSTFRFCKD